MELWTTKLIFLLRNLRSGQLQVLHQLEKVFMLQLLDEGLLCSNCKDLGGSSIFMSNFSIFSINIHMLLFRCRFELLVLYDPCLL